jgi:hypothetical protein
MRGLANISITLDTYPHVIPGLVDVAARAMEDALDNTYDAWVSANSSRLSPIDLIANTWMHQLTRRLSLTYA